MIPNVIHDYHPMVMITDIWPKYIRGVNLHYLDFRYVRYLLTKFGGNTSFSYDNIKFDKTYMAKSFRMYVRAGIKSPRKLDTEWLKQVLTQVRSFDPSEVEKIRASIQKQIQARLQAKAKELTSYEKWRKQLTDSQQRQLRGKVQKVTDTLMQGQRNNLVMPTPEEFKNMPDNEFESMLDNLPNNSLSLDDNDFL